MRYDGYSGDFNGPKDKQYIYSTVYNRFTFYLHKFLSVYSMDILCFDVILSHNTNLLERHKCYTHGNAQHLNNILVLLRCHTKVDLKPSSFLHNVDIQKTH